MPGIVRRLAAGLSERFASTWRLLSDTTIFLSRTSIFPQYEQELKDLRARLASAGTSDAVANEVRRELVAMRETLRLNGYDLTLGSLELALRGFRNDAALSEGFRRMVLFIGRRSLWALAGDENHRALHDHLEQALEGRTEEDILQKHYLWYQWNNGLLTISGADTETKDDFEELLQWCEQPENRLRLLGYMKRNR
ncbi:MAG TPA: hypothetical protein VMV90_05780 [Rectinemataceae bacterium]|nr:hypothetical protein [Rectinemataceae bacterium]